MDNQCFVSYKPKANSPCSNRIRAAAFKYNVDKPAKNRTKKKRSNFKKKKLHNTLVKVVTPHDRYIIDRDILSNKAVFVDGGKEAATINESFLRKFCNKKKQIHVLKITHDHLYVPEDLCEQKGLVSYREGKPVYIKCPRSHALRKTKLDEFDPDELIQCYREAIRLANHNTRGGEIVIGSDKPFKYACVGSAAIMFAKGVRPIHHVMEKLDLEKQGRILRHMKQVEALYRDFMPNEAYCQVQAALTLTNAKLFSTSYGETSSIFQGFAVGRNVFLNAHKDKDFTYSAVMVLKLLSNASRLDEDSKTTYAWNDEPVAYFNFPRLGQAVPLKPGDVLFFDPSEEHMISSRCNGNDDIYCISFYLKSNIIGGNDNDKELNDEEKYCFEQMHRSESTDAA